MIELIDNTLRFSFPEVHPDAGISIDFRRTLRIPDDGDTYPLPPGMGTFPLKHVDDCKVPPGWTKRGGVIMPMYQSEAMWLDFEPRYIPDRETSYPFAVKVATGKINALTGDFWRNPLEKTPQDYMVSTEQPWLDGYCVEEGIIRQFVSMPLGSGYSAEEQITGESTFGGLQIIVYPMRPDIFERRFPKIERDRSAMYDSGIRYCIAEPAPYRMGLSPGGKIRQKIYPDPFDFNDWDHQTSSRCFVHIANSLMWRAITGENPLTVPFTAREYENHGLPWFEYYDDHLKTIPGASILKKLKTIVQKAKDKKENPLPENETVIPGNIKQIVPENRVREGEF